MNILFFSNRCESSKILISLMQGENLLRFFNQICTDGNKNIPPQIKVTPTILIKGIPTPYVAGEAFAWFSRIKQWRINYQMQKMNSAQQKFLQNAGVNQTDDSFIGFNKAEMDGLSDMFSFLQNDDINLPHSYFNCNMLGKEEIITPPKEENKDLNTDKTRRITQQMEAERRKQDDLFKTNIDNFKKQYK